MRPPLSRSDGKPAGWLDMLTFEHLMAGRVIHLIYWAGLGLIAIGVFGSIGAAVGVAIRDPFPQGVLMAVPVAVVTRPATASP